MLIKFPVLITEDLLEIAIYLVIFERGCVLQVLPLPVYCFHNLMGKTLKDLPLFLPSGYPGY